MLVDPIGAARFWVKPIRSLHGYDSESQRKLTVTLCEDDRRKFKESVRQTASQTSNKVGKTGP